LTERVIPAWVWIVGVPIGLLLAGLMGTCVVLLIWLSVALSGMFTWLPASLIHALLR
jgi:hypothetical protein